nr:restriction endonuclease subunit S [uncultured Cohaesibacter sp.]
MSELPKGWVDAELGELGTWSSGGTPSRKHSEYYGGEIPWVKTGDLKDCILQETPEKITQEGLENSSAKVFPENTLLIAMYGATIGKTAVLGLPAATNQACAAFLSEGTSRNIVPFLWKYTIAKKSDFIAAGQGGAQPNISQAVIKKFTIHLPPLAEQKRIVGKLDALSAKSARARDHFSRIETLTKRYKQAVLSKAFSGELTKDWRTRNRDVANLSLETRSHIDSALMKFRKSRRGARTGTHQIDLDKLSQCPTCWSRGVVGVAADLLVGYAFKSAWFTDAGVKILRGANVAPGNVDWEDVKSVDASLAKEYQRYLLAEGDIVLAMDRPVISTGLKVAKISNKDQHSLLVQRVARLRSYKFISQDYIWWFLNSEQFLNHCQTRSTGSDLPHISGDDISTCPCPLPSITEQTEIVRRIESAFTRIDKLAADAKRALALTDRLDEAILAKAFRGELVPQDPNDEPASALLARIKAERAATPKAKRGRKKG